MRFDREHENPMFAPHPEPAEAERQAADADTLAERIWATVRARGPVTSQSEFLASTRPVLDEFLAVLAEELTREVDAVRQRDADAIRELLAAAEDLSRAVENDFHDGKEGSAHRCPICRNNVKLRAAIANYRAAKGEA